MWIDEIKLITESKDLNNNGFMQKNVINEKIVYGNRKSVTRDEFYKSAQAGFKINCIFELKRCDYDGQEIIEFENKRYRVLRDYAVKYDETIELSATDISEER